LQSLTNFSFTSVRKHHRCAARTNLIQLPSAVGYSSKFHADYSRLSMSGRERPIYIVESPNE